MRKKLNDRGLTRAGFIILAGIIVLIISIAIPFASVKLEEYRESLDLAQARIIYSDVMIAAVSNDDIAEFEGQKIKQSDGSFKVVFAPIRQKRSGWTMKIDNMNIGGIPSSEWRGKPKGEGRCVVMYQENVGCTVSWGNDYGHYWRKYVQGKGSTSGSQEDNEALHTKVTETITHNQRKEADLDALDAIADYFVGRTPKELQKVLGEERYRDAIKGKKISLLKYVLEKETYALKMEDPSRGLTYLEQLGYDVSSVDTEEEESALTSYLFTSEPIVDEPGTESEVKLKLHFDKNMAKVVKAECWIEGLTKEGYKAVIS